MRTEVKTFIVTCDRCKKTEIVTSKWSHCDLPEGWDTEDVHDCGSTGYTRTDDICSDCLKKRPKKKR